MFTLHHSTLVTDFAPFQLLILVQSHSSAFGARREIRKTWGMKTSENFRGLPREQTWRTLFVLGKSATEQWERLVAKEEEEFADVLQADFLDSQFEGTRHFLLGVTWLSETLTREQCRPRFVLLTQHHSFHNMFALMPWLQQQALLEGDVYMGKRLTKDIPIRDAGSPLFVPAHDFPERYFPDMIQGPQFLFSMETLLSLTNHINAVPKIAMQEGYIALLARRAGVRPTHSERFVLLKKPSNICHVTQLLFVSDVKASDHRKILRDVINAKRDGKCANTHVLKVGLHKNSAHHEI